MKILRYQKRYFGKISGFIRFKRFEINYSFLDWALPINITFSRYLIFIRVFFVSVIIDKK